MTAPARSDHDQILDHVRSIFDAYLRQDRDTIRRTHADDWTGFLVGSAGIERGIARYLAGAEHSLATFRGTAYQILDHELRLLGDHAVLFYTARYEYRAADGAALALMLRSVDLYRRDAGKWLQWGSHIAIVPENQG